jgi:hypothetical protein
MTVPTYGGGPAVLLVLGGEGSTRNVVYTTMSKLVRPCAHPIVLQTSCLLPMWHL